MKLENLLFNKVVFTSLVVGLVVVSILVSQYVTTTGIVRIDSGVWGIFYTIFGVIYPIVLGFLLVEALGKYSRLSTLLDEEINELQDMRDALVFLDNPAEVEAEIYASLKAYAESIADREWGEMIDKTSNLHSDTSEELYRFMEAVHSITPTNRSDEEVLNILMNKTFTITTLRTQRINLARQSLPGLLHLLINFMALVFMVTLSLTFATAGSLVVQFLFVASLVTSTHLLYQIIIDLDNPFSGSWQLDYRSEYRLFAQSIDTIAARCSERETRLG